MNASGSVKSTAGVSSSDTDIPCGQISKDVNTTTSILSSDGLNLFSSDPG